MALLSILVLLYIIITMVIATVAYNQITNIDGINDEVAQWVFISKFSY